jgi:cbb3-type cytochrome oxidase subunit 3
MATAAARRVIESFMMMMMMMMYICVIVFVYCVRMKQNLDCELFGFSEERKQLPPHSSTPARTKQLKTLHARLV